MIYTILYVVVLVIANLTVTIFGPWFSVINSFILIGFDFTIRDKLHDKWNANPIKIGGLILIAGIISYICNPASGIIAIASVTAFCLSMVADSFVYQLLRSKTWAIRVNGSNAAGACVDSLVFPTIAFGGLLWHIVLMQCLAKIFGGFVWAYLLKNEQQTKQQRA